MVSAARQPVGEHQPRFNGPSYACGVLATRRPTQPPPRPRESASFSLAEENPQIKSHTMSEHAIGAPARKLDDFEELVYEYTTRMGLGNEEVCPAPAQQQA